MNKIVINDFYTFKVGCDYSTWTDAYLEMQLQRIWKVLDSIRLTMKQEDALKEEADAILDELGERELERLSEQAEWEALGYRKEWMSPVR